MPHSTELADAFNRPDESLDAYFHKKEYIATSMDGLPGLPLPLPPLPRAT